MNKNTIFLVIAVVAILITGVLILGSSSLGLGNIFSMSLGKNSQAVANSAVDYVNKNLVAPGTTATLQSTSAESGVIKLNLLVGGQAVTSYVSADGKLFFRQADVIIQDTTAGTQPTTNQPSIDSSKVMIAGNPFIGKADAPVVMAFWSDYQCHYCKKAIQEVFPQLIKDYVNTGKIKVVFKDYAFLGADSTTLGKFARAVWEAAPSKFEAWHQAITDSQGQTNAGWATEAKIMEITTKAIGGADAQKALALFKKNGDVYQGQIDADKAEGTSFGINGTPGTIVGKKFISGADTYANFKAAVDLALAEVGK